MGYRKNEPLNWRELVIAAWVLGVFVAFVRQMLSVIGL